MPDATATSMTADVLTQTGPALSATSDLPSAVQDAAPVEAQDGVDAAAEAEQPSAEEAAAAEAGAEDGEQREAKPDNTDPKIKAAITKERNKRREAEAALATEREAAASDRAKLAAALESLTKKPEPEAVTDRPRREDFDNPDAYETALEAYVTDKAATRAVEAERQRIQTETVRKAATDLVDAYKTRVEAFTAEHDDFDDVFSEELPVTLAMTSAIMNADNGPDVAYWLGKNPDEAARISKMPDAKAVFEMGRIAAKLAEPAPEAKAAPPKPAPIKPLGQRSGSTAKDPNEMSTDEYAAYRNAQLKGGGQAAVH